MQMEQEQSQDEVIVALQRQINELTENNLLLKEQLARKEQFVAMIAHELRSPLTPIINYAQIVARPNQRRETIERGTNIIMSQAWRLSRLVSDLLDNAIKYSPEETTILVQVWQTPGKAHVSVHNEGEGIPFADIDQLFRPYSRLQGTSGTQKGSGLGLYIAKSIVVAHGGELHLERSTEEKQGTTFSFDLPV